MSTAPRLAAAKRDWGHDETGCTVLHIDMDAFYASLEVARHPELKGRPVIIGTGPRSVVSAASYEARRYGINSAMPSARARQLCPDGVFLPVDMRYYRSVSREIMTTVFHAVTDQVEQVSVDEGYMDVSGALLAWKRPSAIGAWIRAEVERRFHVTCSVGVAANKLIAKMASTNAKPNGMLLIPKARSAEFVQLMPLRGIPGIGPSLEKRLNSWGIDSVADLAATSMETLQRATGSPAAAHGLWMASRGLDDRTVTPIRVEKSIGSEETLLEDTTDQRVVCRLLREACDEVAGSLRRRGFVARTVTVKLRFADLSYRTRSRTLQRPVDTASALYPQCVRLLHEMLGMDMDAGDTPLPKLIRLAGMSASGLSDTAATAVQPSLDDMIEEAESADASTTSDRRRRAEAALDAVRQRFGNQAVKFGA
ncbi:DNA polymerase IV [Bifidobacterium sp. UTCIF-37]|uniref:DNA polymerase IV n=1 Tax=unclassified Bifidobacterium TaxID=2608897 RepID=UPI0011273C98|nr:MULTISPECIES: DNA polymerase IV [unclassified Bifidobacterium]TPF87102.1 DNA polymerase IV [Bifidobacterium sp. UTCIF-37]TPF90498.1 DNA polymerase IV [Bifidobacterium sp. UTCIF-38]